jgi:hypothetical protein
MKKLAPIAMAAAMIAAPAMAQTVTYNTAPASGFLYGSGNDYSPANAAVLSGGINSVDQIALRFHQTGEVAPASDAAGVYSFALGTTPISFDWSLDFSRGYSQNLLANTSITVMNVGTGQTVSYNPFFLGNDNYADLGAGVFQNSARLNFGFLLGNTGFTPNIDSLYSVNLTSNDNSLTVYAKLGAGAVPEPATWALFILGFGLIGAAMRRKTSVAVRYA